jgi:hypothetical protein
MTDIILWRRIDLPRGPRHFASLSWMAATGSIGAPTSVNTQRFACELLSAGGVVARGPRRKGILSVGRNQQTIERARRFVWASDHSHKAFIHKYMGNKREPLPLFPNLGRYKTQGGEP